MTKPTKTTRNNPAPMPADIRQGLSALAKSHAAHSDGALDFACDDSGADFWMCTEAYLALQRNLARTAGAQLDRLITTHDWSIFIEDDRENEVYSTILRSHLTYLPLVASHDWDAMDAAIGEVQHDALKRYFFGADGAGIEVIHRRYIQTMDILKYLYSIGVNPISAPRATSAGWSVPHLSVDEVRKNSPTLYPCSETTGVDPAS